MNEHKISFIICCNNEFYMDECRLYLSELMIPEGMEMDIIEVRNAVSITAGYNEGMRESDAKYKVYLHQDVFIKNKNFISDIISLFQLDEKIGMIGMSGTPYLIRTGIIKDGIRLGGFYKLNDYIEKDIIKRTFPIEEGYIEVEAIEGFLIATQYDLFWREDCCETWDFYDVSQSFEFQKAGYKVIIPGQNPEWYFHDCGIAKALNYGNERKKFLNEYSNYMNNRQKESWEKYKKEVKNRIEFGYKGYEELKQKLIDDITKLKEE